MALSLAKQKALAIIPKITGGLSFLCSVYIIQHILRDRKRRRKTYHRIILGLSISDALGSFFGFFLSTWPMPAATPMYGAMGTITTCSIAGFFNHVGGVSTPLYNGSLALYYLLMIVYDWSEERLSKIEWLLHLLPVGFGWGTAIAGLFLNLYNSANWVCWIAPLPPNCEVNDDIECIRGNNASIYRLAFAYGPTWCTIIFTAVAMSMIYCRIGKNERTQQWYRMDGDDGDRVSSRLIASQAFLYVSAFILTWIFGTFTRLLQFYPGKTYFPIIILMTIFLPLQGFFNVFIYEQIFLQIFWQSRVARLSISSVNIDSASFDDNNESKDKETEQTTQDVVLSGIDNNRWEDVVKPIPEPDERG